MTHECGLTLNDGKLLAKLIGDDSIAQELEYHHAYFSDIYDRERSHLRGLEKESAKSKP